MKLLYIFSILSISGTFAYSADIIPVKNFGSNPGEITMYKYVPENLPATAPLVVSLHGCLQDATTYSNVGWKELADKWKFYVVFPEQNSSNNEYRCWNWFQSENIKRGQGEAKSIIEMVDKMKTDYSIDNSRVYIEGLSAGGWMVSDVLASYPDVFAGGAINAGGPAFCANTERYSLDIFGWWYLWEGYQKATKCMNGIDYSPNEWGELLRNEGYRGYNGSWPIISIWHGSADKKVDVINQQELVDQWTHVHGIDSTFDSSENIDPDSKVIHQEYHNNEGKALVETYLISDMQHGVPIISDSENSCGKESDYILDLGICAVLHIGRFWGLDE